MAFPSSSLLQAAEPPPDGGGGIDIAKGISDAFGNAGPAFGKAISDGFAKVLEDRLPQLMVRGIFNAAAAAGDWLADKMTPFYENLNIVTQRPEDWLNHFEPIRGMWEGSRWIATVFLLVLLAGKLVEWSQREADGAGADSIAEVIFAILVAGGLIQISMLIVDTAAPYYNTLLEYAANAPTLTDALPAWAHVQDIDPDTPEGVGKLIMAIQAAWIYWHAAIGMAFLALLLVLMPYAIAAAAWDVTDEWFERWASAAASSLVGGLMVCYGIRITRVMTERLVTAAMGTTTVAEAAPYLIVGAAMFYVVIKLARLLHSGIDAAHPFAGVRRMARQGKGVAGTAAALAVAPFSAVAPQVHAAAQTTAQAAHATGVTGGAAVAVPPAAHTVATTP